MATIYDVAKAAKVTAATVSYVLTGKGSVSEETRLRVLKCAQELGYRPNLVARSLTTRQTFSIGLVVPRISNPFYAEIAETTERIMYQHGFRVLFVNTAGDEKLGQELLNDLIARRVDGLIIMPDGFSSRSLNPALESGMPVVCCMWEEDGIIAPVAVGIDFEAGGRLAGQHLLELGHQHIAIISEGEKHRGKLGHHLRVQGFRDVFTQAGKELDLSLLTIGDSSIEGGIRATEQLLRQTRPPTAIFATNDLMAIGAISAIYKHGLQVPTHVSVVGFDDIQLARYIVPPLTTIKVDKEILMQKVTTTLFKLINGEQLSAHLLITPTLMVRNSTRRLPVNNST
ncbi:MAG: substrate-binding domain-containing protein [Ktedonobacteraceae bacterium]